MNKNKAFTLAEVLVTLIIIGVISAITIPTIKKISDERAYVTAVKKAYMSLSTTVKNIKTNEGPVKTWDESKIKSYFTQRMNVTDSIPAQYTISLLNGNTNANILSNFFNSDSAFVTIDGMLWTVYTLDSKCQATHEMYYHNACLAALVDINGKTEPNMVGVDVFAFYITPNDVLPFGSIPQKPNNGTDCTTGALGWTCSTKIIQEGKISW